MNYFESVGKIKLDSVVKMFQRSEEKYRVRYAEYDGDSKTYSTIKNVKLYGYELLVQLKKYIGHVGKMERLRTGLRNTKMNNKSIGGNRVGKLTNKAIISLTKYYGLAVRRNSGSIQGMYMGDHMGHIFPPEFDR